MGSKWNYLELIDNVEEEVKAEIPAFKSVTPHRRFQLLTASLKNYCTYRKSADKYKRWEKTNPMYTKYRQESEYFELLSLTRLRLKLQACDEYDLQKYVIHLNTKLEEAMIETRDIKKRFALHDYICAGCVNCKVDNENIMAQINNIRERAKEIIREIPTM